ncbi:alpha/beta hydrolase domain protein [Hypoxylon rubiginosum]|uniref:Alpha/beta hydrolase domain protein n=1 Tax=Hypoxylon rubiginosum TaxID=110542 RepID=A0ACC0CKK1_9PEZI|nr:alpha/beta hydrolase domain protein [Hypoxylon rubiginosum]
MTTAIRPPYDQELASVLHQLPIPSSFTLDDISTVQKQQDAVWTLEAALEGEPFQHEELSIASPDGNTILLSIFRPVSCLAETGPARSSLPCIVWIHGGGMLLTNRFVGVKTPLAWAKLCGAVVVSVEYRVAPAHPAPAAVEDCYTAVAWVCDRNNAERIGVDVTRVLVTGVSAGGGLAAGVSLMARDRALVGGPRICGLVLMCPMLNDRVDDTSKALFGGSSAAIWSAETNEMAWKAILGDRYGDDSVSPYEVPGRATDLSGLPPTYIDVASVELFRNQCIQYAARLWDAGCQVDLHVWAGGFHGFNVLVPNAALSKKSMAPLMAWVQGMLQGDFDDGTMRMDSA